MGSEFLSHIVLHVFAVRRTRPSINLVFGPVSVSLLASA